MTASIDLFVFGGRQNAAWQTSTAAGTRFCPLDAGAGPASGPRLNELVAGSQSEFVALAADPAQVPPPVLEQLSERLRESPELPAVIAIGRRDHISRWIWSEFPAQLAILIQPPAVLNGALFRREAIGEFGPFHDVDEPLWDWFITVANRAPDGIAASETDAWSPEGRFELPALAPAKPGSAREWLRKRLYNAAPAGSALLAGLLQVHDYLDESHSVSQNMEGTELGDHWHGIMHRREPDYSNAKYWYRRIGKSPLFPELAQHADRILTGCKSAAAESQRQQLRVPRDWDALAFVDFCESQSRGADDALAGAARQIQFWEMLLLLRSSFAANSA